MICTFLVVFIAVLRCVTCLLVLLRWLFVFLLCCVFICLFYCYWCFAVAPGFGFTGGLLSWSVSFACDLFL